MVFEALMTALLAWQIWMPATNNGMYMFQLDRDGTIIRMNTQDGTMDRCDASFQCSKVSQSVTPEPEQKESMQ